MLNSRATPDQTSVTALWIALVALLTVAGSFVFACVAPLAAIAALAASTMRRGEGLALVVAAWLANQLVGFALLSYPLDASTIGWGLAIGAATACGYLAASLVTAARLSTFVRTLGAFVMAFAVYQAVLYVYGIAVGDSGETFTPAMIGNIFLINAVGFAGFLALHRAGVALSVLRPSQGRTEATV